MAGQYDIFISGDAQAAKDLVARVLGEQGFSAESNPNGGLTAKRGNATATAFLGAMAGKNLQMTFFVEYSEATDKSLDVRVSRNLAASALKGGAIGASRTNNAFVDLVNAIGAAAQTAGTFVGSVAG
ncbi:MAG TPA: hypothetical protein VHZ81_07390 [Galbitalea sp.]|nr:hypothetical protein [Galbitalea sp.]